MEKQKSILKIFEDVKLTILQLQITKGGGDEGDPEDDQPVGNPQGNP